MLQLERIGIQVRETHQNVLRDFCLEIGPGEKWLIEGCSGSGKSVLARLLAGIIGNHSPLSVTGTLAWNGEPLGPDSNTLRASTSIVFQNSGQTLLMPTVEKEMAFPLENRNLPSPEIRERIQDVSAALGIENLLHRDPQTLSGGEQQRVALATALVSRPRLLILDEPEAHLDPGARSSLADWIQAAVPAETSILILDHEPSRYRIWADHTLRLPEPERTDTCWPRTQPEPPDPIPPWPPTHSQSPVLEVATADLEIQPGRSLQGDFLLQIRPGEIVFLTGPNGVGKTSLLTTILSGKTGPDGVRKKPHPLPYLPQEPALFFTGDTTTDELEFMHRLYPDQSFGWAPDLKNDHSLRGLSAGQAQFFAASILLYSPASLFFLDEPTSHMDDLQTGCWINRLISRARSGAAFLIVTQDPQLASHGHRVLHLGSDTVLKPSS